MSIRKFIPSVGKNLVKVEATELIEKIGEEAVKEVVTNVLCGLNIRSLTENLTRKRLAISNASLLVTYLKASQSIPHLPNKISDLIKDELLKNDQSKKLTENERVYLRWLVGLTGKADQNVLRSSEDEFVEYMNDLEKSLQESLEEIEKIFGDLSGNIVFDDKETDLSWSAIIRVFMAIGAQTLTIRGSEKSVYGKLFEKFILGSLLSILGFSYANNGDSEKSEMIFWLSERKDKRESDATALVKLGKAVRFDIGFIGSGNTEISLDKVSRFEKTAEINKKNFFVSTIVIVDRIGEGSRIVELAKEINGNIVQMSMALWVREVATILHDECDFEHEVIKMSDQDCLNFIRNKMEEIDLQTFIGKKEKKGKKKQK